MGTVLKLGGSLLDTPPTPDSYEAYRTLIDATPEIIAVVVGGGTIARDYITVGRHLGLNEPELDRLGVDVSQLNANVLAQALTRPAVYTDTYQDADTHYRTGELPVLGGTTPGQTTDTVAAKVATKLNAEQLLIATDIDGIYTANPDTDTSATHIDTITITDLLDLFSNPDSPQAGHSIPIDTIALEHLKTTDDPPKTCVLDGTNPQTITDVLSGHPSTCTTITS